MRSPTIKLFILCLTLSGVVPSSRSAPIVADNSGRLLTAPAASTPSDLRIVGALTLNDPSSTGASPIGVSDAKPLRFTSVAYETAPVSASSTGSAAMSAPATAFDPSAMSASNSTPPMFADIQPVPEPSTWCAAALSGAMILWHAYRRFTLPAIRAAGSSPTVTHTTNLYGQNTHTDRR